MPVSGKEFGQVSVPEFVFREPLEDILHPGSRIDADGLVTAKGLGTTDITVTTIDGGFKAVCSIEVVNELVPAEGVLVTPSNLTLKVGESYELTVKVSPENATNKNVTWTMPPAGSDIVSINNGKVTALRAGVTNVMAHTIPLYAGDYVYDCACWITVENVVAEKVVLDKSAVNLKLGESTTLSAIFYPSNTTDKTVEWSTSAANIVSVDKYGNISARSAGKATITAKAKETGLKTICYVTVSSGQQEGINEGVGFDDLN